MANWWENIGNGLGINWNPLDSPIWKGEEGYKPEYKDFNPAEYQGLDTSALGKALRQDIGQNAARSKGRLQASLQRSGGGGADAVSGLAMLEGQQGQQENILNAQLAAQDYDRRWQQYLAKMDQEKQKAAANPAKAGIGSSILGGALGLATGGAAGGFGSALGNKMAEKWF